MQQDTIDLFQILHFFDFWILLFRLYLKKLYVIRFFINKKISLKNLKPILPVILRILYLKCHAQTSRKAIVMLGLAFIKFK